MCALDTREASLVQKQALGPIPAAVAVRYLQELPETWRRAAGGEGRRLLASAVFDRIEVLGMREATVPLSEHAVCHGLGAALRTELGIRSLSYAGPRLKRQASSGILPSLVAS